MVIFLSETQSSLCIDTTLLQLQPNKGSWWLAIKYISSFFRQKTKMASSLSSWLMPLLLAAGCLALVLNIWSARKVLRLFLSVSCLCFVFCRLERRFSFIFGFIRPWNMYFQQQSADFLFGVVLSFCLIL